MDGTAISSIELVDPKVLRVCADPRNLPFSNDKGEGFENKLGELFAEKLQKKLDYMYFPQADRFRADDARPRIAATSSWAFRRAMTWSRAPIPIIARLTRWSPSKAAASTRSRRWKTRCLKGKHIGIVAGTPPATNMAVNGLMANAKPYPLMIDTRIDSSAEADDRRSDVKGEIDAGILWGPMAGFYARKQTRRFMSRRWSRKPRGRELVYRIGMGVRPADQNWKRLAQPPDPGEPAGDQQDPARLRRSAARRERPADRRGDGDEVAMRRRLAPCRRCRSVWLPQRRLRRTACRSPENTAPTNYRAPVPATLAGARVLTTAEAETIWRAGTAHLHRRAAARAKAAKSSCRHGVARASRSFNIPGSIWLPDTGYGKLAATTEDYLRRGLTARLGGNKAALLVIYCQENCWMSWNAAKRVLSYGYSNVAWYPEGDRRLGAPACGR